MEKRKLKTIRVISKFLLISNVVLSAATLYIFNMAKPDVVLSGEKIKELKSVVYKMGSIQATATTQSRLLRYYVESGGVEQGPESLYLLNDLKDYFNARFFANLNGGTGHRLSEQEKKDDLRLIELRGVIIHRTIKVINNIRYGLYRQNHKNPSAAFEKDMLDLQTTVHAIKKVLTDKLQYNIQELENKEKSRVKWFTYLLLAIALTSCIHAVLNDISFKSCKVD